MVKQTIKTILEVLQKNLETLKDNEIESFINEINKCKRIFIIGAGRSGLVGRSFGMRLMHLGYEVYIIGDTITPAINAKDLLIAISGSGKTSSVKVSVETAVKNNAKISIITGFPVSIISKIAEVVVEIPTVIDRSIAEQNYEVRQLNGTNTCSYAPLGTIFELSSMIFCDSVIAELMRYKKVSEKEMQKKHSNFD